VGSGNLLQIHEPLDDHSSKDSSKRTIDMLIRMGLWAFSQVEAVPMKGKDNPSSISDGLMEGPQGMQPSDAIVVLKELNSDDPIANARMAIFAKNKRGLANSAKSGGKARMESREVSMETGVTELTCYGNRKKSIAYASLRQGRISCDL